MIDERFFGKATPLRAIEIAASLGLKLEIPEDVLFFGVAQLNEASKEHISFFHNSRYLEALKTTKAGGVILAEKHISYLPEGIIPFITPTPYRDFSRLITFFYKGPEFFPDIHPTAIIDPTAHLGDGCTVGPYVVIEKGAVVGSHTTIDAFSRIGHNVCLGSRCRIESHVSITHALIGDNVKIKSGARIGQRGFGFQMDENGPLDVPQMGRVLIEDFVQIGSNTCIDRGSQSDTVIGRGARIDNLVQIAHNVKIGSHCIIVAQVGISGSTELGHGVIAAGQAGFAGHLKIGDSARIAAQSGVMRDIPPMMDVAGSPSMKARDWHKQTVVLKRMIEGKDK